MLHVRAVIFALVTVIAGTISTGIPASSMPLDRGEAFAGTWRVQITCVPTCDPTRPAIKRITATVCFTKVKGHVYAGNLTSKSFKESKVIVLFVKSAREVVARTRTSILRLTVSYSTNRQPIRLLTGRSQGDRCVLPSFHFASTIVSTWTHVSTQSGATYKPLARSEGATSHPAPGIFPGCP
ncbi:MAG: hypothetical protein NVS2B16_15190 [Chloroflexota bacterium]